MPTVKELKKELKEKEIPYPKDALKADLEKLIPNTEETPRHKAGERPGYIASGDDFVDPSAEPDTQA